MAETAFVSRATFQSVFALGDKVFIDGHDLSGVVIGVYFADTGETAVKVGWWNNGDHRSDYFAAQRLSRVAP